MQYNIHGDNMPVVICSLDDGESMICEAGAMSWMTPNMEMETKSGGAGKLFGRVFSDILAVEVTPEKPVIIQKRAFLACTAGVQMEVVFQKKLGTAIFGGEGFIMQKLSGRGTVFLEIDGSTINYNLKPGQQMLISTGHLAMMDETVTMDIQQVKGVKNILFGGESMFNTVVTGPGVITLQTMPMTNLIAEIVSRLPGKSS